MLYWLHGYGTKRRSLKSFFSFWWETLWVSAYLLYALWIMQIGRNEKESPWASSRTLKHSRSTSSWNPLRMEYGFVHKWLNPRATVNSSLALESLKNNLEMRVYLPRPQHDRVSYQLFSSVHSSPRCTQPVPTPASGPHCDWLIKKQLVYSHIAAHRDFAFDIRGARGAFSGITKSKREKAGRWENEEKPQIVMGQEAAFT